MSETVDHLSRPIALSNLREWVLLCKSEMNVQPDMYDSDVQRAADELHLINAYRDMAIKAGYWPCKKCSCFGVGHTRNSLGHNDCMGGGGTCGCRGYEPATLENEEGGMIS